MSKKVAEHNIARIPYTVYSPESKLRHPGKLLGEMWRDLMASRELAWRLIVRDISVRYRQTLLGILWAFLPPLATVALFLILQRASIINTGKTDVPYPVFVFVGTIFWQLFTDSLNAPLKMVVASRSMLVKINFPREAIIISAMGQVLFDFGIRFLTLPIVFAIFHVNMTWGLLFTPLTAAMLMLLGIVIGMSLVPLGMLYNDVVSFLALVTNFWLFVTPVAYQAPKSGVLHALFKYNPVAPLLVGARSLATKGVMPNAGVFLGYSGAILLGLFVVWVLYRISLPILIERLGS